MSLLLQTLIFGTLVGGVYALMATGLTLVFGVMRIVNIAHASFLILSAYLTYTLWEQFGIDPLIGAFLCAPILGVIGAVLYKLVIERSQRIDHGLALVATFALALIVEAILALTWGPEPRASTPSYFNEAFQLGTIVIPKAQLYACALALVITVVLTLLLKRTWLGHAITAASENPEGARLVGIDAGRVGMWIFALSLATTAFGGAALGFLYQFVPDSQDVWIGLTMSVVILGGLGSVPGAIVGGIVLGVAQSMTATFVSLQLSAAVPLVMIVLVLTLRPSGLLSRRSREDVVS